MKLTSDYTDNGDGTYTLALSKGQSAIIDEGDLPLIAPHRWHASRASGRWYAGARIPGSPARHVQLHRLLLGEPPQQVVALDGDHLNCRRSNLAIHPRGLWAAPRRVLPGDRSDRHRPTLIIE